MKLYVQERGCYHAEMKYQGDSDMQNFRVFCEVFDKNGRVIFCEFVEGRGFWEGQLLADIQYTEDGMSWRVNPKTEYNVKSECYKYTKAGVLAFVNAITGENYTEIVPFNEFYVHEHYKNWTGAGLMVQWVRDNKMADASVINSFGSTFLLWRNNVWEWDKVISEQPKDAEYPDVIFALNRITDKERAERIIENGVEVINTVSA